jgi:hypothetical protein
LSSAGWEARHSALSWPGSRRSSNNLIRTPRSMLHDRASVTGREKMHAAF